MNIHPIFFACWNRRNDPFSPTPMNIPNKFLRLVKQSNQARLKGQGIEGDVEGLRVSTSSVNVLEEKCENQKMVNTTLTHLIRTFKKIFFDFIQNFLSKLFRQPRLPYICWPGFYWLEFSPQDKIQNPPMEWMPASMRTYVIILVML